MLSSRHRFHGHASLRFVYSKGQVTRSKFFICKSTVNHRRTEPRVAVVVSKKVVKSAVKRNRIRRRIYEAVRHRLPSVKPQTDIALIVISAEALTAAPADIEQAVASVFTQAGLFETTAEN